MDLRERRDAVGRHPWEVVRSRAYRRLLAQHVPVATVDRVLDVGAGDGWFAEQLCADLTAGADVVCWDTNYGPAELDAGDGRGVHRTATRPDGLFDVVFALDVLEHVEDDEGLLADAIVPALSPGGTAILSAPAHPLLFSDHDRMLQHVRRYRPAALFQLVGRHLDVVATGSLFTTLVPPRAVDVALQHLGRSKDAEGAGSWSHGPALTRAVTSVLELDATTGLALARSGLRLPGLSAWVVAKAWAGS